MLKMKLNSLLTIFLFLGTLIITGYCDETIICVCDSCPDTNYTCATTDSCLTTLKRSFLEDEGMIERGCASHVDMMFFCEYSEEEDIYNRYVQRQCCYEDYCNQNASISFPGPQTTSPPTRKEQHNDNENVSITFPGPLTTSPPTRKEQHNENENVSITFPGPTSPPTRKEQYNDKLTPVMVRKIMGGVCSFVFLMTLLIIYKCKRHEGTPEETSAVGRAYDASSGGSQLQYLGQSTVASQISIVQLVGRGRFGQVYRAKWKNEQDVAVKSFNSSQDGSFIREIELYQTVMLRHQNILGFIASDTKDNGLYTQLWLITDYHKNGSLCDYLQRTTLNVPELLKLAQSAARGLAHLHSNVLGSNNQGKPAMAHRDIKSKNILVKDDGTCCIADLGLAVRKSTSNGLVDVPTGTRVGTSRYMAPEFLGDFQTVSRFDCYKGADMYSFGLVLWEMTRRCVSEGVFEEYQLPYYEKVPGDPSVEEVYEVVCVEKYRPCCSDRWERNPTLKKLSIMMKECWKHNPLSRLTSARVSKSLKTYMDTAIEQDTAV